ncbi:MAG: 16S rRNA (guanine(527)-N(7))-methyltransferase RsmG [Clostridiales bacterium]|nr:16S rRNA (guanine(527)-N(7))-methyltransferase RsmG [Clostridiales bacterium]
MNRELFLNGLKKLNIEITDIQTEQFEKYSDLLKEWNEKINLTAITDDDGISIKHFLDCILLLKYIDIPENASVADIGTGAGFPGLPVKIMRSDVSLCLVDSLNKRINFLNEVKTQLGLDDVQCIHSRAEELARKREYREKFDFVLSRAVANMTVLCEYCLPFLRIGGTFVALKSSEIKEETEEALSMIGNLGGKVKEIISAPLPESDITRSLVVIEKVRETPKSFPRSSKRIKQSRK